MKSIKLAGAILLSAGMIAGAAEWVTEGAFSASSTYGPNTRGNVFDGGHWCGAKNWQDWIQLDFEMPVEVAAITIGMAGTDITTQDALITIKLQGEDGQWITVDELEGTNINYEELTDGRRGDSIPTYRKDFEPMRAKAFRLELVGHGWFRAEDIRIWPVGAEVTVAEPAPAAPASGDSAGTLAGSWDAFVNGRLAARCAIAQDGETLTFTIQREPPVASKGRWLAPGKVVADDWGAQEGTVSKDGHRIDWADSYWLRASDSDKPASTAGMPADLEIRWGSGAIHAEWGRTEGTLQSDGSWTQAATRGYGDEAERREKRGQLSPERLATIWRTIEDNRFFELERRYADMNIMDGSSRFITVTANGRTHTVSVMNTSQENFARIMTVLYAIADDAAEPQDDGREAED